MFQKSKEKPKKEWKNVRSFSSSPFFRIDNSVHAIDLINRITSAILSDFCLLSVGSSKQLDAIIFEIIELYSTKSTSSEWCVANEFIHNH